ncbi:NTP transferase domain-containing protein [Urechidicola croceus]|uniref:MobA-like NTP transferase domain-containing protein n=1 Tax=Urechidicola croceus TaxID=1850246 RepID=A0A1D8PBF2_9FLAO|nr:NTP transferase domain-containing protein [Urechidicola croceus]AOW21883.1 hypothetical protein LPB138_14840 [Urechidicola croceus]
MKNNTVFILLAGGKSERMGTDKGLLKYNDTFWILEQLHRISKSTISTIYVGLGYNYKNYFEAIHWFKDAVFDFIKYHKLNIKIVINQNPELGSFSTLLSVLKKIDKTDSIIINPIDTPLLNPIELNKIIDTDNIVIIPSYENKNGHPIKLKSDFWSKFITLNPSDKNSRLDYQIKNLKSDKISIVKVNDNSILKNLNYEKDWLDFLDEKIK